MTAASRTTGESGRLTDSISLGVLARVIHRDVIDDVLAETGKREQRYRRLPAHVVVYFVVALAIFRDGYEEVVRKLVNGLLFLGNWNTAWQVPSTSAMSQARVRLGEKPMKVLFERLAVPLAAPGARGAWMRGRRLMAIDGVQIDVPDTEENFEKFGKAQDGTRRPYPQIRSIGLGECGTHAVVAAELGTIYDGERKLAMKLLGSLEPDMLVLADRGFFSFDLWKHYMATGAALAWRVTATLHLPVKEALPDGSFISVISSKPTRSGTFEIPLSAVDDPRLATHIPVRVVEYTIANGDDPATAVFRLITTILDPSEASALELAAAYQQRWEYEIALSEIETQLLDNARGLRSKKPELVHQEFWGLLLAHYAIRALMTEAADAADIDPDWISFTRTLNIVRRQVSNQAAFSPRKT